jgi:glycerophosphoryl diester phosphodiesterase
MRRSYEWSKSKRMNRALRWLLVLLVLSFVVAGVVSAQSPAVALAARAMLPGESYADGPRSGVAFAERKTINGVAVPFANQPVSSISAVIKGWFRNTWLLLTDKGFGSEASADFLVRAYTVEVDWLRADGSGRGVLTVLDWITFSDPRGFLGAIKLANTKERNLTGADLNPVAFTRMADGSLWLGDGANGRLLHFGRDGFLLEKPRTVSGGQLVALGGLPDGVRLVIGLQSGDKVAFALYAPANNAVEGSVTYPLEGAGHVVSDVTMINATQALIVEQDRGTGASAQAKAIYQFDLSNGQKVLLADLLNISDPAKLGTNAAFGSAGGQFGLSGPFKFPYDVSGVYPLDASTLVVVNNNHFPFSTARRAGAADGTELIQIRLNAPLSLQLQDSQE